MTVNRSMPISYSDDRRSQIYSWFIQFIDCKTFFVFILFIAFYFGGNNEEITSEYESKGN